MNTKKIIIALVVVLVVIVAIAAATGGKGGNQVSVTTEDVELRSITEIVSANGKVQPEVEVKMSSDVPGEIVELTVIEGQKVEKGTLLAKINPDIYESVLNRAHAALNSAEANAANSRARVAQSKAQLLNAKAVYNRQKELFEKKVISQADYDQANANFEVAKADVMAAEETMKASEFNAKSARASLKEAQDNLKRTSIYAPMDGTVSKLDVEMGERVVGTSQMAGTEMMRVADLTRMEVNVEVNESDIVKVKLGDVANVEVDAYVGRKFKGKVTEIANSSANSGLKGGDQVTVFNVKVRILEKSYKDLIDPENPHLSPFRPGMSATVEIMTNEVKNIVAVPIQAVTIRADSTVDKGSKWKKIADVSKVEDEHLDEVVFVYEDGKAIKRKVKTGIQDTKYMQILEGVNEGDVVISGPYSTVSKEIKDGDKVEVKDKSEILLK